MASIIIEETTQGLSIVEQVTNLKLGEYAVTSVGSIPGITIDSVSDRQLLRYEADTEQWKNVDDINTRIDKVIQTKNITATTYAGGTGLDKLSEIVYTDTYSEDLIYDGSNKLQYIDHKLDGTVIGYTTLTYNLDGKFETYTYTDGAR